MTNDFKKRLEQAKLLGTAMGFIEAYATILRLEKNTHYLEFEKMYQELKTKFENLYNTTTHEAIN